MAANPVSTPNMQKAPVQSLKSVAKYDYGAIASDWTTAMQIRRQWDQDVILLGDQLYRQRAPTTPYLKVLGDDGLTNLATQVTDPTITFLIDKAVDNDCDGPVLFRVPGGAAAPNRAAAAQLVDFALKRNTDAGLDLHRRIAWNFNIFGWNAIEVTWLDDDDAAEYLDGFPVMVTLHDPLSVAYELDGLGMLKRVIVAKQMLAGALPQSWRKGVTKADEDLVQVYEHFDREQFAAVVDGNVVDSYAHQAVNVFGMPCVPFAIKLHDEKKIRLGDAAPTLSASSPREIWVGSPAWMSLYKPVQEMSYYRTALRFNVKENIFPWAIAEGAVEPDYASHTVQIPSLGAGKWSWAEVPNLLADINLAIQSTDQQIQSGGMGPGLATGQTPTQTSGTAVNAQTTFVKQRFEALRASRMALLRDVGLHVIGRVKANTAPSTADKYKAATGKPLAVYGGNVDVSRLHTNGTPLPMSAAIQGYDASDPRADQLRPINSLTLAGIVDLEVSVESMDTMPRDQRMQLAMNLWNQKIPKLPDELIYTELWGIADPEAVKGRLALQLLENDPNLPLQQLAGLRAWANGLAGSSTLPPNALAALNAQLAQADQFELTILTQKMQELLKSGSGQPQGGPNGPPPAAPPPPPMHPGIPPGVLPPGSTPGLPPPGGMPPPPPPPNGMVPGVSAPGGTPAPAMGAPPPPPMMQPPPAFGGQPMPLSGGPVPGGAVGLPQTLPRGF